MLYLSVNVLGTHRWIGDVLHVCILVTLKENAPKLKKILIKPVLGSIT